MSHPALPALLLLALVPGASTQEPRLDRVELAQLTIHQRIVVRIPRLTGRSRAAPVEAVRWVEKKGPKCVAMASLDGAIITGPDSVDLMVDSGERLRAKLDDDCPALDFYSGFYLRPTSDGMICADRDVIRARSGSACPIDGFKRLVAKR